MIASLKSVLFVLFVVLATLNVVSAVDCYKINQSADSRRFTEYCCNCIDKGLFGECHISHSATCTEATKLKGEHDCPRGAWPCYTDNENPVGY